MTEKPSGNINMDIELIYLLIFAGVALSGIICAALPNILTHIHEEREAKRRAEEHEVKLRAEYEARRAKEEDLAVLLTNLIKVDTAMDYMTSRGSNKENKFSEVLALLHKTEEPKE